MSWTKDDTEALKGLWDCELGFYPRAARYIESLEAKIERLEAAIDIAKKEILCAECQRGNRSDGFDSVLAIKAIEKVINEINQT